VYTMIVSNFGDRLRIVKNSYSFKDWFYTKIPLILMNRGYFFVIFLFIIIKYTYFWQIFLRMIPYMYINF
jgi:hypothetical protein